MPNYTPQELELLALVEHRQQRTASTQPAPQAVSTGEALLNQLFAAPGPAPRAETRMMVAAQAPQVQSRELANLERLWGVPEGAVHHARGRDMSARMRVASSEAMAVPTEMDFEASDGLGAIDLDGMEAPPQVTNNDHAVLESLFMGREAQEAAQYLGGDYGAGIAAGQDVMFDSESLIEGRTTPNESARWRVGREDPPRVPFNRGVSGQNDGVVVSARGRGGSWEPQRRPEPSPRPPPREAPSPVANAIAAVREAARVDATPRPVVASSGPRVTVYQQMNRGIFDD